MLAIKSRKSRQGNHASYKVRWNVVLELKGFCFVYSAMRGCHHAETASEGETKAPFSRPRYISSITDNHLVYQSQVTSTSILFQLRLSSTTVPIPRYLLHAYYLLAEMQAWRNEYNPGPGTDAFLSSPRHMQLSRSGQYCLKYSENPSFDHFSITPSCYVLFWLL
jgi:hypothetical protein